MQFILWSSIKQKVKDHEKRRTPTDLGLHVVADKLGMLQEDQAVTDGHWTVIDHVGDGGNEDVHLQPFSNLLQDLQPQLWMNGAKVPCQPEKLTSGSVYLTLMLPYVVIAVV